MSHIIFPIRPNSNTPDHQKPIYVETAYITNASLRLGLAPIGSRVSDTPHGKKVCACPPHLCIVLHTNTSLFSCVDGRTRTCRVSLTLSLFWAPRYPFVSALCFPLGLDFSLRLYEQYEYLYYFVGFVDHMIMLRFVLSLPSTPRIVSSSKLGCIRVQQCLSRHSPHHALVHIVVITSPSRHAQFVLIVSITLPSHLPHHGTHTPNTSHTRQTREQDPHHTIQTNAPNGDRGNA